MANDFYKQTKSKIKEKGTLHICVCTYTHVLKFFSSDVKSWLIIYLSSKEKKILCKFFIDSFYFAIACFYI